MEPNTAKLNNPPQVLVIEDDDGIQRYIERVLTDEGYEVLLARDGGIALKMLETSHPDLILLDMYLPTVDGWSFLAQYPRTPLPHAPIIAMSAGIDVKNLPGVVEGLAKPFTIDALLTRVKRHVPAPTDEQASAKPG
jgi:two-component system response regulator PrrA